MNLRNFRLYRLILRLPGLPRNEESNKFDNKKKESIFEIIASVKTYRVYESSCRIKTANEKNKMEFKFQLISKYENVAFLSHHIGKAKSG
jgi:hypothetical protein